MKIYIIQNLKKNLEFVLFKHGNKWLDVPDVICNKKKYVFYTPLYIVEVYQ